MKKAKYGLRLSVAILFVIICTSFQSAYAQDNPNKSTTGPWLLEGHFINFNSICDITKPELFPKNITLHKGTVTLTMCGNLEEELSPKPLAVIITILNTSKTNQTLIFPSLSDFIIHTQEGPKSAIAYCYSWFKMGLPKPAGWPELTALWVTKDNKARFSTEVSSGEQVELVYLVPRFSGKATIELKNIGSFFRIDAPRDAEQN